MNKFYCLIKIQLRIFHTHGVGGGGSQALCIKQDATCAIGHVKVSYSIMHS